MIADVKRMAKQYPGSYELGVSGRAKLNGVMVSFIAYTNPENVTGACYIIYTVEGKDHSITRYNLDIFDKDKIKLIIAADL